MAAIDGEGRDCSPILPGSPDPTVALHEHWQDRFSAFTAAVNASDDSGAHAPEDMVGTLDSRLAELARQLADLPAATPAGIAGKLRVALDYCCASPRERQELPWPLIEGALRDLEALRPLSP